MEEKLKEILYDELVTNNHIVSNDYYMSDEKVPYEIDTFIKINSEKGRQGFTYELLKKISLISEIRQLLNTDEVFQNIPYIQEHEKYQKLIDSATCLNLSITALKKIYKRCNELMGEINEESKRSDNGVILPFKSK
jgi:hypothetical protein